MQRGGESIKVLISDRIMRENVRRGNMWIKSKTKTKTKVVRKAYQNESLGSG